jgi:hypothetical protein
VRRLTVAHEAGHGCDRDRLLREQLGGYGHPAPHEILAEGALAEALVGALHLPRRGGERPRDDGNRELLGVMALDHQTHLQVQAAMLFASVEAHTAFSEALFVGGTSGCASAPSVLAAATSGCSSASVAPGRSLNGGTVGPSEENGVHEQR